MNPTPTQQCNEQTREHSHMTPLHNADVLLVFPSAVQCSAVRCGAVRCSASTSPVLSKDLKKEEGLNDKVGVRPTVLCFRGCAPKTSNRHTTPEVQRTSEDCVLQHVPFISCLFKPRHPRCRAWGPDRLPFLMRPPPLSLGKGVRLGVRHAPPCTAGITSEFHDPGLRDHSLAPGGGKRACGLRAVPARVRGTKECLRHAWYASAGLCTGEGGISPLRKVAKFPPGERFAACD